MWQFKPALSLLMSMAIWLSWFSPFASADDYTMGDNAIYHEKQGHIWQSIEAYDAAIKEFKIALVLKPDTMMSASLFYDMGVCYMAQHRYRQAAFAYEKAIDLNPSFGLYYTALATALSKGGLASQSIKKTERQSLKNTDHLGSLYFLAMLYKNVNRHGDAQKALEKYLKMAPDGALAQAATEQLALWKASQPDPLPVK